jgi:hypothetical protein
MRFFCREPFYTYDAHKFPFFRPEFRFFDFFDFSIFFDFFDFFEFFDFQKWRSRGIVASTAMCEGPLLRSQKPRFRFLPPEGARKGATHKKGKAHYKNEEKNDRRAARGDRGKT